MKHWYQVPVFHFVRRAWTTAICVQRASVLHLYPSCLWKMRVHGALGPVFFADNGNIGAAPPDAAPISQLSVEITGSQHSRPREKLGQPSYACSVFCPAPIFPLSVENEGSRRPRPRAFHGQQPYACTSKPGTVPKSRSAPPRGRDPGLGTVSKRPGIRPQAFPQFTAPRVSAAPGESVPKSESWPRGTRNRSQARILATRDPEPFPSPDLGHMQARSVPKSRSAPHRGRDSGLGAVFKRPGIRPQAFPQFTAPRVSAAPDESVPKSESWPRGTRNRSQARILATRRPETVPKSRSAPPRGRDPGLGTLSGARANLPGADVSQML